MVCASSYFKEFDQFDEKVKTGVLATATSFLNQFQEYRASQIFCPDPDKLVIKTMDEVVDQGKILLFDIASPGLARSMGTFIKLHYEQSVLNRLVSPNRGKEPRSSLLTNTKTLFPPEAEPRLVMIDSARKVVKPMQLLFLLLRV